MMNQGDDNLDPTIDSDKPGENIGSQQPFAASPSRIPKQIGNFRIKKLIATGGMGAVYQGVQEKPRRTVAIKLMKSGVTSASALRRFEYESQLLARLKHPGIAEVYYAGTHDAHDGAVPYFVMEYIAGAKRITDYARDKRLGTRERLKLFNEAAAAVHYGHTKGIIHRDLKPDNVLVDSFGKVKVIDFGVARATDSDMAVTTLQTDIGQLIGTVQYMSPEQVEAEPDNLDTRSDVYSLGVILYETLCGKLPYDVSKMKLYDATRVVRETEALKLSTIDSTLRGDVETIVAKTLEKDRDRRYQTAQELVADIDRYLNDEPITARPPSLTYQLRVFARRNKGLMTGVAAVFGALLLGLTGMSWLYVDTISARNAEREQRQFAEQQKAEAKKAEDIAKAATLEVLAQKDEINRRLYAAQMANAAHALTKTGGLPRVRELTDNWLPKLGEEEFRGWEWYYLRSELDREERTFSPNDGFVQWTEKGIRLMKFDFEDGSFTVRDADTRILLTALPPGSVQGRPSISKDGNWLAVGQDDGAVKIWDLRTGDVKTTVPGQGVNVREFKLSSDGTRVAIVRNNRDIEVTNVHTGVVLTIDTGASLNTRLPRGTWSIWSISKDGNRLAVVQFDGAIKVWDLQTGDLVTTLPSQGARPRGIELNSDGTRVAIVRGDGLGLVTMNVHTRAETTPFSDVHQRLVTLLAWSPDDCRIASGSIDRSIKLWDAQTGDLIDTFRGHGEGIGVLGWSPDGARLVSHSTDGGKIWDANVRVQSSNPPEQDSRVYSLKWSPDGQFLAWANSGRVTLWNTQTSQVIDRKVIARHRDDAPGFSRIAVAWSPDSRYVAYDNSDATLGIWDTKTRQVDSIPGIEGRVISLSWSPKGDYLACFGDDDIVQLWKKVLDTQTFELDVERRFDQEVVKSVVWSPDRKLLVLGGKDKMLHVWDVYRRQPIYSVKSPIDPNGVAWNWSSGDLRIATKAGAEDVARVFNMQDVWTAPLKLKGHTNWIKTITWSPDGTRIATGGEDDTLKIWETEFGREVFSHDLGHRGLQTLDWSPDGQKIAIGYEDGNIKIWDASRGYKQELLRIAREGFENQGSDQRTDQL